MAIRAKKSDVIWSYVGTGFSVVSGFLLLPFLVAFLDNSSLGLWYVFIAISNMTQLFEFGFAPTFSRNIVYCMSGARKLSKTGYVKDSVREGVDYHLLKTLLKASKLVYAVIALIALALVLTVGSLYIDYITRDYSGESYWAAWTLFCVSIFLNLYYLYTVTNLRGIGDIASENRAKTLSRAIQLVVSVVLLFAGLGLVGAAIGYLLGGISLRLLALRYFNQHKDVCMNLDEDAAEVTRDEIAAVLRTVSHLACRDGVVEVSLFFSTQAASIMCSLILGLEETGTYSIILQFAQAAASFATAYASSNYPAFQSSYVEMDKMRLKVIVGRSGVAYFSVYFICMIGVALIALPLIMMIRDDVIFDPLLLTTLSIYVMLFYHHVMCCSFIACTNKIPYMTAFLASSIASVVVAYVLSVLCGFGAYGLACGFLVSQLAYNNWKWPRCLCDEIGESYSSTLLSGIDSLYRLVRR